MQTLDENPHLMEAVRSRVMTRQLLELPQTMARLTERIDRMAEQMERLRDDVGTLKGWATDGLAQRVAPVIALAMNLHFTKNLDGADLSAMLSGQDLSGISHSQLESFLLADLIMETTDTDGRMLYVAVESSYTADERDTRRAIRNARYLTRFTGAPARAAITAVRTDWNINDLIASGAVHWYKMPERLLQSA